MVSSSIVVRFVFASCGVWSMVSLLILRRPFRLIQSSFSPCPVRFCGFRRKTSYLFSYQPYLPRFCEFRRKTSYRFSSWPCPFCLWEFRRKRRIAFHINPPFLKGERLLSRSIVILVLVLLVVTRLVVLHLAVPSSFSPAVCRMPPCVSNVVQCVGSSTVPSCAMTWSCVILIVI